MAPELLEVVEIYDFTQRSHKIAVNATEARISYMSKSGGISSLKIVIF